MAVQASGVISFDDLNLALGNSKGMTVDLDSARSELIGSQVPTSGQVSLNQFYGSTLPLNFTPAQSPSPVLVDLVQAGAVYPNAHYRVFVLVRYELGNLVINFFGGDGVGSDIVRTYTYSSPNMPICKFNIQTPSGEYLDFSQVYKSWKDTDGCVQGFAQYVEFLTPTIAQSGASDAVVDVTVEIEDYHNPLASFTQVYRVTASKMPSVSTQPSEMFTSLSNYLTTTNGVTHQTPLYTTLRREIERVTTDLQGSYQDPGRVVSFRYNGGDLQVNRGYGWRSFYTIPALTEVRILFDYQEDDASAFVTGMPLSPVVERLMEDGDAVNFNVQDLTSATQQEAGVDYGVVFLIGDPVGSRDAYSFQFKIGIHAIWANDDLLSIVTGEHHSEITQESLTTINKNIWVYEESGLLKANFDGTIVELAKVKANDIEASFEVDNFSIGETKLYGGGTPGVVDGSLIPSYELDPTARLFRNFNSTTTYRVSFSVNLYEHMSCYFWVVVRSTEFKHDKKFRVKLDLKNTLVEPVTVNTSAFDSVFGPTVGGSYQHFNLVSTEVDSAIYPNESGYAITRDSSGYSISKYPDGGVEYFYSGKAILKFELQVPATLSCNVPTSPTKVMLEVGESVKVSLTDSLLNINNGFNTAIDNAKTTNLKIYDTLDIIKAQFNIQLKNDYTDLKPLVVNWLNPYLDDVNPVATQNKIINANTFCGLTVSVSGGFTYITVFSCDSNLTITAVDTASLSTSGTIEWRAIPVRGTLESVNGLQQHVWYDPFVIDKNSATLPALLEPEDIELLGSTTSGIYDLNIVGKSGFGLYAPQTLSDNNYYAKSTADGDPASVVAVVQIRDKFTKKILMNRPFVFRYNLE